MRLTRAQSRAFHQRVNIYRPVTADPVIGTKLDEGLVGVELAALSIPCRLEPKSEVAAPIAGLGSSNIDQMDTTDVIRLPEYLVDITDEPMVPGEGWFIRCESGFGQNDGDWYALTGEARTRTFAVHCRSYLVKQTTAQVAF